MISAKHFPRIRVVTAAATQVAALQKDYESDTRTVERAKTLERVYAPDVCFCIRHTVSWKVRLITSFCCSRESLLKLTA